MLEAVWLFEGIVIFHRCVSCASKTRCVDGGGDQKLDYKFQVRFIECQGKFLIVFDGGSGHI